MKEIPMIQGNITGTLVTKIKYCFAGGKKKDYSVYPLHLILQLACLVRNPFPST